MSLPPQLFSENQQEPNPQHAQSWSGAMGQGHPLMREQGVSCFDCADVSTPQNITHIEFVHGRTVQPDIWQEHLRQKRLPHFVASSYTSSPPRRIGASHFESRICSTASCSNFRGPLRARRAALLPSCPKWPLMFWQRCQVLSVVAVPNTVLVHVDICDHRSPLLLLWHLHPDGIHSLHRISIQPEEHAVVLAVHLDDVLWHRCAHVT